MFKQSDQQNELLWDHFKHPCNTGILTPAANVVYAQSGSRAMESLIEWYWQIDFAKMEIQLVRYRVFGDMSTIAVCSWLSVWLTGKTFSAVTTLAPTFIIETLGLSSNALPNVMAVIRSVKAVLEVCGAH